MGGDPPIPIPLGGWGSNEGTRLGWPDFAVKFEFQIGNKKIFEDKYVPNCMGHASIRKLFTCAWDIFILKKNTCCLSEIKI